MSLHRRAAKRDANEPEIVATIRQVGAVWYPASLGNDGWVGWGNVWVPWEIKDGRKPPSARKLTDAEADMQATSAARGLPYRVVTSVDEALAALGITRGP